MGFNLLNGLSRFNSISGFCRLLNSRYTVLFIDDRGAKQSIAQKLNIPEHPKKPLTPYIKFFKQIRESIVKENPQLTLGELSKKISQKWQNVDHKTRIQLEIEFQRERKQYDEEKKEYFNLLTTDQRIALEEEKQKVKDLKNKKLLKQKAKDLDKPKKPLSSYMLYSTSRFKDRGSVAVLEWQKKVTEDWKSLDESEKQKYIKQAAELRAVYLKQLQEWEEKVVDLGHTDLLRNKSLSPKLKNSK